MITNLCLSPDKQTVTWENDGQPVVLAFDHHVLCYHVEYRNEVLLLADG